MRSINFPIPRSLHRGGLGTAIIELSRGWWSNNNCNNYKITVIKERHLFHYFRFHFVSFCYVLFFFGTALGLMLILGALNPKTFVSLLPARCWPCLVAPGSATHTSLASIWPLCRTRPWSMRLALPQSNAPKASWLFPPTLWGINAINSLNTWHLKENRRIFSHSYRYVCFLCYNTNVF